MSKASGKVTIKKYANRRLYDTESSTYITLDRVDEEARGSTMLPINFLKQLIGLYGNSMQNFVPSYLEAAMDAFQHNQSAAKDAFGANVFADLAKRNMAMFEDASRAFTGKPKNDANNASSDVEQLKAELAALQAKVDRLSR